MGLMDKLPFRIVRKSEYDEIKTKVGSFEDFVKYIESIARTERMGVGEWMQEIRTEHERIPRWYVPVQWYYDVFKFSDTVRNIIRTIRDEIFKNGLVIEPAYAVKCGVCGTEYETEVEECDVCGNKDSWQYPDKKNRKKLEDWIKDVNYNDQTLEDVLREIEIDLDLIDNAFLLIRKKYAFDEKGELVSSEVIEVLRLDPKKNIRLIMNREGVPARDDAGNKLMFCLEHRNYIQKNRVRCEICGKKLFPAYYVVKGRDESKQTYYTRKEIIHIKKFTSGIGYGVPPLLSVWRKIVTLMLVERYIFYRYKLQRPPQGILIVKTSNHKDFERAWDYIVSKTKENPHMIYPLVLTGDPGDRRVAEYFQLSTSEDSDALEVMRSLMISVGAVYGVMPLYMGEAGRGLTNEGLQVTITNRMLEMSQRVYNEKVLPEITKALGVGDWRIKLAPVEERDEDKRIERIIRKLEVVRALREMGYDAELIKVGDDIDFVFKGKTEESQEEVPEETEGLETGGETSQRFEGAPEETALVSSVDQKIEGMPEIPRRR